MSKLKSVERKRSADGNHRLLSKIKDLIYDVSSLISCFSGSHQTAFTAVLVQFYLLQFLHENVSVGEVSEKEVMVCRDHVITCARKCGVDTPTEIAEERHFNLIRYLLASTRLVTSELIHSNASIVSPQVILLSTFNHHTFLVHFKI